MIEELLFSKQDLVAVMQNQEKQLSEELNLYDANRLLNTPNDDLIEYFYDKFNINPLCLSEDQICVDQKEVQIDVSHDQSRFIYDRSRPVHITGTAVILEIPFTGDADLLKCRASTYTFNPPRGEVKGNKLYITVTSLDHNSDFIRQELDNRLNSTKQ